MNRASETQGPAAMTVAGPSGPNAGIGSEWLRRPALFSLPLALALAVSVPLAAADAQSRDDQRRFPGVETYPSTPNFPARPVERAPVVIGTGGSGVTVNMSVLETLDRARERELVFPDPNFRGNRGRVELTPPAEERITLTPPGGSRDRASATSRPAPRLSQPPGADIQAGRPATRPAAPARSRASAPPPPAQTNEAPAEARAYPTPVAPTTSEPAPEPAPSPEPESMPAPEPTPPTPAFDRSAVPPPPMEPPPDRTAGTAGTAAEVPDFPPVSPAPRTDVTRRAMATPEPPPPAPEGGSGDTQAAALPPDAATWTPGDTRAIDFPAGTARLPDAGEKALRGAARALAANERLRIELKAFAAGDKNAESQARRLSLSRALSVRSFLIREGVQSTRIDVRALGNRVPGGEPDRVDVTLVSR